MEKLLLPASMAYNLCIYYKTHLMQHTQYEKFVIQLAVSLVIMYGVMFLNVDSIDHVYLSLTRLYMSLLMVSPMALLMLWMMKSMYTNRKLNLVITVVAIGVFITSLAFLRNQTFISDKQYMRAMIPHHSSAIMTSKNATIKDPSVKKLSDSIIASQEREIAEMKSMLAQ